MFEPKQPWHEFVESTLRGAPSPQEMFQRWGEVEVVKDQRFPDRPGKKVPKNNGEENLYRAWLAGQMDPEEAAYFASGILRPDVLVELAMVPLVRLMVKTCHTHDETLKKFHALISAHHQTIDSHAADIAKIKAVMKEAALEV
jgi:hypothetical protein